MSYNRLQRVSDNWIAGVCGGIADFFGFDRDLTRIIYLCLTLFTVAFPGTLIYIALWILMPKDTEL